MNSKPTTKISGTKRKHNLCYAARTGHYPAGTTAQDLLNTTFNKNSTALHIAAEYNNYPPGTTAKDLTQKVYDARGWTPLHVAAYEETLPPDVTKEQLINTTTEASQTSALASIIIKENKIPDCIDLIDLLENKIGPETPLIQIFSQTNTLQAINLETLLDRTQCQTLDQIKQISHHLKKRFPVELALWSTKQLKRINALQGQIPQIRHGKSTPSRSTK